MRARKDAESDLDTALAMLISSTRRKRRPLPLTDVNKWLQVAVDELGGYEQVADRVGVSAKMLRQFSAIDRLSSPVQRLFEKRALDSVDAAAHLAMLQPSEQKALANELVSGNIATDDVRAIVQLRKFGDTSSLTEILEKVKASKTKKVYIAEFVVRGALDAKTIRRVFEKHVPSTEIVDVDVRGAFGRLVLTPAGKKSLQESAKQLGKSLRQIIPTILYG